MERRQQNRVSLRLYLPDFIQNLDSNIEELQKLYNENHSAITLYLWYDENDTIDLNVLKEFIKTWESKKYFRTIIKSNFTNLSNEFIWFDIIPSKYKNKSSHVRFSFSYFNSSQLIVGIKHFGEILSFTNSTRPKKVQKRTDHSYNENSDSR